MKTHNSLKSIVDNNFKLFLNNFDKQFSKSNELVFYGASKDLAQLLESLDILLKKKIKISYFIDDQTEGEFNSIYDLNEAVYKPDGWIEPNQRNIKVTSSELFFNEIFETKKFKIITTSDANKNKYFQKLISYGLKPQIDFFDYKEFVTLIPFIKENITHIWRADIMLTEKCTLNCTFCNMYMPHFKKPKHRDLNEIKSDLDKFFSLVDYISLFHLVGGEPLMYPNVNEVIDYVGRKYRDKVGRLLITTNGTLTPKENTINLIKKYKLWVSVSDYTSEIKYERRLKDTVNLLKKNNVAHLVRKDISWNDFGHPEIIKFSNEEDVKNHFQKCTAPYKGINNGRYYFCHLNTSANLAGLVPENKNDFCELNEIDNLGLIKHDLGFLEKGYATFCKNCNGCNTGINLPVGPGKQGLRDNI